MTYIKNNFKKILSIFLILSLGLGIFIYTTRCKLDGSSVCFNNKLDTFKIEENAQIVVQVESEAMGEYLVKTWNTIHTQQQNVVSYIVKPPLSLTQLADDLESDVFITSSNNAAYVLGNSFDMGKSFRKEVLSKTPITLEAELNALGNYFVPNSYTGWSFVYNKTLLESLGVNLEDANHNYLPDSFETWEQLVTLDTLVFETLDILFPLSFKDQYSFYPFLTSGKWGLNFTKNGEDAGLSHPEFLKGLEFIEFLSQANLYKEDKKAEDLLWEYNVAFFENRTAFSLMSDWMNFEYYQEKTDDEYVIAPLPSFKENTLRPKGEVDGYLVDKETLYPSASAEAIRILRSAQASPYYSSDSQKVFAYHRDLVDDLELDQELKNKIYAYNFIDPDPVIVLERAPQVLARFFLHEVDFMEYLEKLYDGELSAVEAQKEIEDLHKAWLSQYIEEE